MINETNDVITGHDFNDDMRDEFPWPPRRVEANGDIRVIVFDGEGERAFRAGAGVLRSVTQSLRGGIMGLGSESRG